MLANAQGISLCTRSFSILGLLYRPHLQAVLASALVSTSTEAPANLLRHLDVDLQLVGELVDQARVLLHPSAGHDHVNARLQDLFGQLAGLDAADSGHEELVADNLLDVPGEWGLVGRAGLDGGGRLGVDTAGADVDQVDTLVGEDRRELGRLSDGPGLRELVLGAGVELEPVSSADADEKGHLLGDGGTDALGDLGDEADSVFEAAAVLVRSFVADGAQEGVEQVAVGRVDLDNIESGLDGTLGGLNPVLLQLLNVLKSQSLGDRVDGVLGDGRGSDNLVGPAANLLGGDGIGAQPRSDARCLAAGVCELDGDLLVLGVGKGGDALEGLDLAVLP